MFYIFVAILIILIFFYPKDSGYYDEYGPDHKCQCLGIENESLGLEGGKLFTCLGISYSCKIVDYNFNTTIPNPTSNSQSAYNQERITTYTACGCGCCGGTTPNKKCLYHSKGDNLDIIIQKDTKAKQNPQCITMGCSIGTKYSYCD